MYHAPRRLLSHSSSITHAIQLAAKSSPTGYGKCRFASKKRQTQTRACLQTPLSPGPFPPTQAEGKGSQAPRPACVGEGLGRGVSRPNTLQTQTSNEYHMADYQLPLQIAGETLIARADRSLFWEREATLFVADTHWGKDSAFRTASIAVPGGGLADDLMRLTNALSSTQAQRLIILGDLFHAKQGLVAYTLNTIEAWRAHHPVLDVTLIRGNHDRGAGDPPTDWNFRCVDAPEACVPFSLQHLPRRAAADYVLAGHLHPCAALHGMGRQTLAAPCFWFGPHIGVLPAFGSFTGCARIKPHRGDQIILLFEGELIRF